ncbi:NACHT and Ankyrin domain protein [Planoprotostelium fungivorum]|uniref:NACHT and Ankyrin domain protein n=1 Tax=Planoprotostelium fungivorum TaxID=1890364 RepID=A0A2P6N2G3_9EUKA|nr:NACHT and Ankyrin domain protein [Planoprotostelium fungivorum]
MWLRSGKVCYFGGFRTDRTSRIIIVGELMQWHDLPEEVIHLILVHLRGGDRLSSMLVCKRWHEACLLLFDPTEEDCRAVRWACMNNRPICADYLMRDHRVDELKIYNDLLLLSVQFDHVEIIDLLLLPGRADPSMCWNCPLEKAAELGHGSVVERLLIDPRVEPTDAALWTACLNNRPEVIEILLADARVDPSESNNLALRIAEENDFFQVADVLLRDYRVTERRAERKYKKSQHPDSNQEPIDYSDRYSLPRYQLRHVGLCLLVKISTGILLATASKEAIYNDV